MEPILVKWIDAQRIETNIQDVEDVREIELIACECVGFLVYKDKKKVIIA